MSVNIVFKNAEVFRTREGVKKYEEENKNEVKGASLIFFCNLCFDLVSFLTPLTTGIILVTYGLTPRSL